MTATAAQRPSSRGPWSPRTPAQSSRLSSTTPLGFPAKTPSHHATAVTSKTLSPHNPHPPRARSPNYFEYVTDPGSNPPNSNAGLHAKKNWSPPSAGDRPSALHSPQNYPLEIQPRYENFRRQSDNNTFDLSHANLSQFSAKESSPAKAPMIEDVSNKSWRREDSVSPKSLPSVSRNENNASGGGQDGMDIDPPSEERPLPQPIQSQEPSSLDQPFLQSRDNVQSPANLSQHDLSNLKRTQIAHVDERHPRNSLPHNRAEPLPTVQRAETLPGAISTAGPTMVSVSDCVEIMKSHLPQDLLILDLRVYPQYSKSRVRDAVNLCIPTTLLKRSSFNLSKLSETFTKEHEKAKFAQWRKTKFIIVYDASSLQLRDATSCVNTLKKFTTENFDGATVIVRGGFSSFAKKFPDQIDQRQACEIDGSNSSNLSIDPPAAAPVAGGCMMPATKTAANPFFGTIRQNMDLIGGVGQIPITLPSGVEDGGLGEVPSWLRRVSLESDKGKTVADRFLGIEKAEQQRMQKALQVNVRYGTPNPLSPQAVQIAGIEKGTKNRYKDMLPYDHSRVRLQDVPSGECDYVNASYIKTEYSSKHYIASQAPVPATFEDFWRVAWEQDIRVIVMLTAETEGGQRKCQPYWLPEDYGPFKVKSISERSLPLESSKPSRSFTSPTTLDPKGVRPGIGRRRSTNHSAQSSDLSSVQSPTIDPNTPHVTVRKLTLAHANKPFEPLREITQLQYSSWPDFGAPAHPTHVLGLVELCNRVIRSYDASSPNDSRASNAPTRSGERPIVVHCSAGCGRTGTFCTVDSVVDMLKRQRQFREIEDCKKLHKADEHAMDVDMKEEDGWLEKDDQDLIAKAVSDFRLQRLSMVQTLRQFVLCYESILEWIVGEMPDNYKGLRGSIAVDKHRSWGGPI